MAKRMHNGSMAERGDSSKYMREGGEYANLPQEVMRSTYKHGTYGLPEDYDDGITGIDSQMASDHATLKKHFKPKKF